MTKDLWIGVVILLVIISITLFGGAKKAKNSVAGNTTSTNAVATTQQDPAEVEKQAKAEAEKKLYSQYKGVINLYNINKSSDPTREYLTIKTTGDLKTPVSITGWTIKSTSSGTSVTIPKGTYLFFAGTQNVEGDISLDSKDTLYLITGISPNGASFKLNKCSGYTEQFQTFVPSLGSDCPLPKNEDLSSIPNLVVNDACFDYIDSLSRCRIQTESLPITWSYECTNFIATKINYPTCVNTHKNDADFYEHEWRVYLKRSDHIWKDNRENIVLYDNLGKVVDTLSY